MSHGSEESEDYWPGYVDALTSMVQVLAFVMMLLAMAVFVLSQNVTKSAIKAIAEAANVDASADSSVNELTAKVVEQLQRKKEQHAAEAAAAQQAAATQQNAAPAPDKAAAQPGEATKPAASPTQSANANANAAAPASEAAPQDKAASPPAPTPASAPGADDALRVERSPSVSSKPAEPRRAPPDDAKRLQLHFSAHEFKMAEADLKALEAFVQNQSANGNTAHIVLRAYAFSDKGAVTDARRVAYYRALSVRGNLMKRGVVPTNIEGSVIDTLEQAKGGIVDVVIDGKKQ